jgi:hypothetical protein
MRWLTASVILIGLVIYYARQKRAVHITPKDKTSVGSDPTTEEIQSTIGSGDFGKMDTMLEKVRNPLHRHQLLNALVKKAYSERSQPAVRKKLYEYGRRYLDEFDQIAPELKRESDGEGIINAPALKSMAIAMEEDGNYQEALAVCDTALKWDLDDGTKSGYAGRIDRIRKKQAAD